jgi:hypothetical protein
VAALAASVCAAAAVIFLWQFPSRVPLWDFRGGVIFLREGI